jgi:hypothetical protein
MQLNFATGGFVLELGPAKSAGDVYDNTALVIIGTLGLIATAQRLQTI